MRVSSFAIAGCALASLGFLATPASLKAQQEPHYLHALSELRTARDYIQYDRGAPGGEERHHAIDEINKAIDEIKHAAWDDGKNTKFAPPDRGVTQGWQPIHMAVRWMNNARGDVAQGVDSPQNQGMRDRIIFHVNEAERHLMALERNGIQ